MGKGEREVDKQRDENFWAEVHRRLEVTRAAVQEGFVPDPRQKKRILKDRARDLAREPATETDVTYLRTIEFLLADERYAIESAYVRQVYPLKGLTPLPCTPAFVMGITNVRGEILSVIDIKQFFDLPEQGLSDLNKVIIVQMDEMRVGILADAILGTRAIPLPEIQPSLPTFTGTRAEYLKGVVASLPGMDERLIVLDVERILSDERIIVHEQVKL